MRIATFGEIMLRLNTQNDKRLIQSKSLEISFAGSEANVAVDLSYWGVDARFLTVVPDNTLGEMVLNDLNQFKVDTSHIFKTKEERLGLLYIEQGANQRGSKVIYDREYSAFSKSELTENYFDKAFEGCDWFHWSGITPGLNENSLKNIKLAIRSAKKNGLKISCDLNYRSKLWKYGIQPFEVMHELLEETNVILGNEEDAIIMLNIDNPGINVNKGDLESESYIAICNNIFDKFPKCEAIAFSKRESISANHNNWSAILATRNTFIESTNYEIKNIVDRVGAGDSFSAGIIYGLNTFNNDYRKTLEFATAASCLKHSISSDYCLATKEEILQLVKGNSIGRIIR